MENRYKFISIFQEKHFRLSIFSIIFLALFLLFTAGCNDSDPVNNSDTVSDSDTDGDTETGATLTDAEWIVFQDGDGPWQEIEIPETGIFIPTVTDSEGRYGIAYLAADAADQEVVLLTILATTAELPQIDVSVLVEDNGAELQVTVEEPENLANSGVDLYLGWEYDSAYGFPYTGTFTKRPGTYDLFATQTASVSNYPTNYIARRDIDLTAGATVEETITAADFDSSAAFSGPYTVSVQGPDGELDSAVYDGEVRLITTNLTEVELGDKDEIGTSLQYSAMGNPLTGDDTYLVSLDMLLEETDGVEYHADYYEGFVDEGDITVSPLLETFDVTFNFNTGTDNTTLEISDIPDIGTGTVLAYVASYIGRVEDGIYYTTSNITSAGRVQDASSFSIPDLSSEEGWSDIWSIPDNLAWYEAGAVVYLGSENTHIQDAANWFSNEVLRLEDGEWFARLSKVIGGSGEAL